LSHTGVIIVVDATMIITPVYRSLVSTPEDTLDVSGLYFPRNYKNIFEEDLGLQQVYEKHLSQKEGLNNKYCARIFSKNRS
jgi:hypothetical protein